MKLATLVAGAGPADVRSIADVEITHFGADSRAIRAGGLFVATRGVSGDGHQFIDQAIAAGAAAVVAEIPRPTNVTVPWVQVPAGTFALAAIAAAFYGHPAREIAVMAVTGTNGKTSVAYLLADILRHAGHTPSLATTVEVRFGDTSRDTIFTTPPAPAFQKLLREMVSAGCSHAAIEASSHGLQQHRLAAFDVAVAGFTNLTRDHLDYHGTMVAYKAAKARLFVDLARKACFNIDDPAGADFARTFRGPMLTISATGGLVRPAGHRRRPLAQWLRGHAAYAGWHVAAETATGGTAQPAECADCRGNGPPGGGALRDCCYGPGDVTGGARSPAARPRSRHGAGGLRPHARRLG